MALEYYTTHYDIRQGRLALVELRVVAQHSTAERNLNVFEYVGFWV